MPSASEQKRARCKACMKEIKAALEKHDCALDLQHYEADPEDWFELGVICREDSQREAVTLH